MSALADKANRDLSDYDRDVSLGAEVTFIATQTPLVRSILGKYSLFVDQFAVGL